MTKPIDLKDIHQISEYLCIVDRNRTPEENGDYVFYKGDTVYKTKNGNLYTLNDKWQCTPNNMSACVKIILTNDPALEGVTQFEIEDEVEQLAYKLYPENINKMMLGLDENKQRRDYFIEDYNYFLKAVKSKQWTDEDMKKAIDMAREEGKYSSMKYLPQTIINSLRPKIKTFEVEVEEFTINAQSLREDWKRGERIKLNSQNKANVRITYENRGGSSVG